MKKIYPVIHVETQDQALANLEIAFNCDTDGVFLISHSLNYKTLDFIHGACVVARPDFFIGVNFLDLEPLEAMDMMVSQVPALWTDQAYVSESHSEELQDQTYAAKVWQKKQTDNWQGEYFGGVAFKYQKPVKDLEKVTKFAKKYMDVVITSGPGTGKAADVNKLMIMKSVLDSTPLAVASGITVENVTDYKDCVDIFLVATGISKDFLNLDEEKVKALVDKVRAM